MQDLTLMGLFKSGSGRTPCKWSICNRRSTDSRSRPTLAADRLSQPTDWNSFPILTGKNASERRRTLYMEQDATRRNRLTDAQSRLTTFQKRSEIEAGAGQEPIEASPYYHFQLEQGTKYLDRSLARKGLRGSEEGVKLLGDFVRGLGAEESERQFSQLFGLFNTGAGAAGQSANLLQAFSGQIAQTQLDAGRAQAQGILGAGEATSNMIAGVTNAVNSGAGNLLSYNMFQRLMDRNRGATSRGIDPVMDSRDVWSTLPTQGATPYDYLRSGRAS
ncbi:MAG: hypothetical protein SGJ26_14280 [Nitrospirota bacterium]|nr:hypothetical protein [Nitrospirota bacterium]